MARKLRRDQTDAERLFWSKVQYNQLGVRFRRQQPIGNYIVDFVCLDKMLIVELDGSQHNEQLAMEKDAERTAWLESLGYRVLRFWDNDVLQNSEGVLSSIQLALAEHSPSPNLSLEGRGNR